MEDKQNSSQKKCSYLIYIAACLAVPPLMRIVAFRRDAEVPFDAGDFAFMLALFFSFCSLAWMVGRKYDLHYALRCAVGGAALIMPGIIKQFGISFSAEMPIVGLAFMALSAFLIGGLIFAISYPFQLLFFKLRSND